MKVIYLQYNPLSDKPYELWTATDGTIPRVGDYVMLPGEDLHSRRILAITHDIQWAANEHVRVIVSRYKRYRHCETPDKRDFITRLKSYIARKLESLQ